MKMINGLMFAAIQTATVPGGGDGSGIWDVMKAIINVLLVLAGIAAVIVIIVAGIQMATSQGDPGKVAKAKNAILYAIIGLVVAVGAFMIVNFVIGNL